MEQARSMRCQTSGWIRTSSAKVHGACIPSCSMSSKLAICIYQILWPPDGLSWGTRRSTCEVCWVERCPMTRVMGLVGVCGPVGVILFIATKVTL